MLNHKIIRKASSEAAASSPPENSGDNEIGANQNTKKGVRMLVILNNRRSIDGGLLFLERRGYQIIVANRLSEAIQNMQSFKPHTILLSWNLKGADVRKTYKVLTEKFKLICIVFAEDNSTRTTASLMSSGIPHSLLSPVSGPSIHMRVQALLRAKVTGREKKRRQVAEYAKMEALKDQAPPDISWEQVPDPQGGQTALWQGKSNTGHDKTYYFKGPVPPKYDNAKKTWTYNDGQKDVGAVIMKGVSSGAIHSNHQQHAENGEGFDIEKSLQEAGEFQAEQAGLKSKGYSFTTEAPQGDEHAATANGLNAASLEAVIEGADAAELGGLSAEAPLNLDDEDFDWEAALNGGTNKELSDIEKEMREAFSAPETQNPSASETTEEPVHHHGPKAVPHFEQDDAATKQAKRLKLGSESLLYKAVKSTLGKMFQVTPTSPTELPPLKVELVSYIYPAVVKCPRFKGILYMASATDEECEELLTEFTKNLSDELNDAGENGIIKLLPRIKIEPLPFTTFFYNQGDFIVQSTHLKESFGFGFINVSQIPKADEVAEPEVLAVSLETDIAGGQELLFDLFIHLPRNNKFILYMNKGSILTERSVAKFLTFGIKVVHIRKKERDQFLAYWARNLIKSLR